MGMHSLPRSRSVVTRTIAAGGAAFCFGMVSDLTAPSANALSIVIPAGVIGNGNTTQINILSGNIINPQIGGQNLSNNSTIGNAASGNGNYSTTSVTSTGSGGAGGGTTGNGNTTQIDILSGNIINPQISFGGSNSSNNSTIGNTASNNGNHSTTSVTSTGSGGAGGGTIGNGNTTQIDILSGNIINPQISFGGSNSSNNSTIGNTASNNGGNSTTTVTSTGGSGTGQGPVGTIGNGNTTQKSLLSANIFNPQLSFGGSNSGNNSATGNTASNNGGNSTTSVTSTGGSGTGQGPLGTIGNGNTTQQGFLSANIVNPQQISGSGSGHSPAVASPQLFFSPGGSVNTTSGNAASNNGSFGSTLGSLAGLGTRPASGQTAASHH
ncbi:MAG: hypothetical protein JO330_10120 [Mycobacteriaceae bacterium]|nr:hypothetical protein [Mycobacteriaceae bacterium]